MVAYFDGKLEEGERIASEVYRLETKADRIRAEFENQLGVGAFLPSFRGELAKLSERLDDVADRAEEAVREIKLRPKVFEDLTRAEKKDRRAGAIRLGLVELAGKATKTTKALSGPSCFCLRTWTPPRGERSKWTSSNGNRTLWRRNFCRNFTATRSCSPPSR